MEEDLDGLKKQLSSSAKVLLLKGFTTGTSSLTGIKVPFL